MNIDAQLTATGLAGAARNVFAQAGTKIASIDASWQPAAGAPVFTIDGKYTSRGWTEWTQGFQFGSVILQFDATGESPYVSLTRDCRNIFQPMLRVEE